MLLTIEKVIILKSVSIFSEIPDESLVEVASVLEEVEIKASEEIFKKGDIGTSMYVIVAGKVRIHDDDEVLRVLGEREVFGELAALDPEPRSASVTAIEDCYLFRIERNALYELMGQHTDVAQGIIRILCQRLRDSDAHLHAMRQGAGTVGPAPGAAVTR